MTVGGLFFVTSTITVVILLQQVGTQCPRGWRRVLTDPPCLAQHLEEDLLSEAEEEDLETEQQELEPCPPEECKKQCGKSCISEGWSYNERVGWMARYITGECQLQPGNETLICCCKLQI